MKKIVFLPIIYSLNAFPNYVLERVIHSQKDQVIQENFVETNDSESVDEETIKQNMISSMDDVLRLTRNATTSRGPRSSGEAPQVRGIDSDKISITIDGVKQEFKQGHSTMTPLNFETLKSVEVTKTNIDLSQSNTISGGVKFVSKDPIDYLKDSNKNGGYLKKQYNSAASEDTTHGTAIYKAKDLRGLIALTHIKADELRLNDGSKLENSSFEDVVLSKKFTYKEFKLIYDYYKREDDSPLDPTLNPDQEYTGLLADSTFTRGTINLQYISKKNETEATLCQNEIITTKIRRSDNKKDVRKQVTTGLKVDKKFASFIKTGAEFSKDRLTSNSSESTRLEYENDGTSTINSFPRAEREFHMAYIQPEIESGVVTITPGLKFNKYYMRSNEFDFQKKSASHITKNLGVKTKLTDELTTNLIYAEGFNAPTVGQVYPTGLHSEGDGFFIMDNFFIPNTDLEHETSAQKEVSISYKKVLADGESEVKFDASYFENDVKEYITLERIDRSILDGVNGTTQFVNIPKVKLYGHELAASYLFDIYEIGLSYNQIRGRNKTTNLFLEDLPADFYTFSVKSFIDKYRLTLGATATHTLSQMKVNPETVQRTESTKGYTVYDVSALKSFDDFDFNLSIKNLGNKKYRKHASHLYESGEDIRLSLKYKINLL